MATDVGRQVAALARMTVKQLQAKYAEAFGEPTAGCNKAWLVKRVGWRLQANAEGGLSERARRRAAELAAGADLRLIPPRDKGDAGPLAVLQAPADGRLPPPGTVLTRPYKGGTIQVRVLAAGFEHEGEVYPSLSAVAKRITGSHLNGFRFFRLAGKRGAA